jgi:hypothetical protein
MNYVSKFIEQLRKYWKKLCKEYDCHTVEELEIVSGLEYASLLLRHLNNNTKYKLSETAGILDMNRKGETTYRITASLLITMDDCSENKDGTKVRLTPHVVILEANLYLLMLANKDQLDILMDYFKISLRHEMGHVIDYTNIMKKSNNYEQFRDQFYGKDDENQIEDLKERRVEGKKYMRKYYAVQREQRADKYVGLTIDDHIRIEKKIIIY